MFSSRDRLLKSRLREEFVVTMKSGAGWRGVLYSVDERSIVLRSAEALSEGVRGAVDGELILFRDQIAYMQRP